MKIYITHTSYRRDCASGTMEADTLDDCINKLILESGETEFIVKKPKDVCFLKEPNNYDWYVEIFDDYR